MKDGLNRRDLLKLSVASGAAFAAGDLFKSAQGASGNPPSKSEQPTKPADLSSLFQGFESLMVNTGDVRINLRRGGRGKPVLLLHGYPETHIMWHKIAPRLAQQYTVILPDLRGYGDSSTPADTEDHSNYSKRVMASDQIKVMEQLGYSTFDVVGHDRGARVAHRLTRDYPDRVNRCVVMDIIPTLEMYEKTNLAFARGYYHWFFLVQPFDMPEHLIGGDPAYFVRWCLKSWSRNPGAFSDEVISEYIRCFSKPGVIHGTCEDYRASVGIDLDHDRHERYKKIQNPLLVLWGAKGFINRAYDVMGIWTQYASSAEGKPIPSGHFLPEESPDETYQALIEFLNK